MSNTQSRIQEQIERLGYDIGGYEYNLLLRGAEIALENQWIKIKTGDFPPYKPACVICDKETGDSITYYLYTESGEYYAGYFSEHHCEWRSPLGFRIKGVTHIQLPTPPKP